ncbi:MAG: chemotaxis protein CheB, partial [Paracoccaceae bacterium]
MGDGKTKPFWVGIGASAGGLEALREVVRNLEPTIGAIYVVLQHMSPQHKSLLTELIGRETSLDVVEITDGIAPQPNTIYISPPNHDVVISSGRLRLQDPSQEPAAAKPSVDRFFQSLAETMGVRAIGIILSGTGSDGSQGVRAVRAAGGITIAQTETSAKYNGMPLSAVDTGCVDLVLSAEEIGTSFHEIVSLPRDLEHIAAAEPLDALSSLFQIVLDRTGVDFREYKPSTVRRRIERRMTALGVNSLDAYVARVREEPEEPKLLFRDMMISVTSFFRDISEFDKLKAHLEPLVEERADSGMRLWVAGCASGEEAYTLLIMVAEALGGLAELDKKSIQVFATDIDVDALGTARRGLYPKSIKENVPEELLGRYFTETDDSYQVSQVLRERIVFTPHNLCQDPPFSNIDIVTCRNLLIYFSHALQSKVFSRLHYALKPSGLVFLGKSESISGSETLFKQAGETGQVFRRRTHVDPMSIVRSQDLGTRRRSQSRTQQRGGDRVDADPFGSMFHALVRTIGPNGLLITSDMHIHRVYGNVDRFLSLSEGQLRGATVNMLREDLRHELRTLISLGLRNRTTRKGMERRPDDESGMRLQLQVHPIGGVNDTDDMALVVFREWEEEQSLPITVSASEDGAAVDHRISEMEQELKSTRESLQHTVEELETANEELQSLNEELQSANEELQSTNEELETTNEELQSTNEELITVNEELQINSYEMVSINQELDSVLSNIAAPVLVVDARLHIVQCSQSARQMFKIAAGVAKPHLSQLSLPGNFPPLTTLMAEVIQTGTKSAQEIDIDGFRGSVVAAPYFNAKGELIGATAIVQDVSDPRSIMLEGLFNHLPLMIWQQDPDGNILDVNAAAARFMGVDQADARGMRLDEVTDRLHEASDDVLTLEADSDDNGHLNGFIQRYHVAGADQSGSGTTFVVAADTTSDDTDEAANG